MTDPLSVTASAAGIVSLGITVCQGLIDYYQKYKDKVRDVAKTTQSIETVLSTLNSLESILKTRKFSSSQGALVTTIEDSIKACVESIDDLQEELERIKDPSKPGFRTTVRAEIQKLAYPFRVGTLARLRADVQEIRSNISFVIDTLNLGQLGDVQNGMSDVKATLASMRTSQIREQVEWLEAPDPTSDYNDASEKRQAGTGRWFVEGTQFGSWLHGDCTFLWLNGLAGCGKSVLSSTVIQKLVNHTRVHHGTVAFYFFKFSDTSKQDLKGLLRSLLLQFSYQSPTGSEVLASLHSRNKYGESPVSALKDALKEVLSTLMSYYIVIDALDEAPRGKRRKEVLEYLSQMRSWEFAGMHMLVTSRDELDIRQSLKCIAELEISLENKEVGEDIRSFIVERLRQDTQLRKWHKYSQEIEDALIDGASGMFRWVDCQFSSLADCDTLFSLRQTLKSLPVDLNETYDRALKQVAHNHKDDAKRLLMWLCHAKRPLRVTEVMHILAIDLDVSHRFEPDRCRVDPTDLLKICPSLIKIVVQEDVHYNTSDLLIEDASLLLLAHFSVREYLLLGQILPDCAVDGGGKALVADDLLARTSLYYLLQFDETNLLTRESVHEYPLINYAVHYGFEHLRASKEQPETRKLAHSLFAAKTGACLTWARLFDIRRGCYRDWDILPEQLATPLFYATKLELVGIVHELLTTSSSKADINKPWKIPIYPAPAMSYTPLQAAVEVGNMELTEILIKSGANLHVLDETTSKDMGDEYGKDSKLVKFSALTVGASNNRDTAIDLLLSKGVNPNHVVDRRHRTALDFACQKQAVEAVEALIRGGADVSNETLGPLESETGWTSLHWTLHGNHHGSSKLRNCKDVVRLLVKAGADPAKRNAEGVTPFLLAIKRHVGYSSILEMGELFYSGAISERDKHDRGPLHFLAQKRYSKNPETTSSETSLLESLLSAGAFLDSQDSEGRTPLATAAEIFNLFILNALLDAGANSKIVDKNGSPPLYILFRSPEAANNYHNSYTAEELCAAADRLCNEEVGYEYCDANGRSVAHVAAENGPIEMIEALVGSRGNFLSVDHEGSTALGKLEWRIQGHSLQLMPGVKPRPNKEDDVEGESKKESGQSGDRPEDEAERPTWHMRKRIYSNDRRKPTLTLDDLPDAFDRFFFRLRSPIARFEEFMAEDIGFSDTLAYRKLFGHLLIRETARNGRWDIVDRMLDAAESHFRLDTSTMVESVIDAANIYQFAVDAYPLVLKQNYALRGKADYVNFFVAVNTLDFEAVGIYTNLGVDVTPNSKMKRACIQRLQHLMDEGVADNMFQITEIYRKLTTAA